jgi:hypothetical protein
MSKTCLTAIIAGLLLIRPALGAETAHIRYSEVLSTAQELRDVAAFPASEHDLFDAKMRFLPLDTTVRPFRLWIAAKDHTIELPIAPNGEIVLPETKELINEDPMVESNQPKGTLAFHVSFYLKVPQPDFYYSDVDAAIQQVDKVLKKQTGIFSIFLPLVLPSFDQIGLTTAATADPACQIRIAYADGNEVSSTRNRFGQLQLKFSDRMRRENPKIAANCALDGITVEHD